MNISVFAFPHYLTTCGVLLNVNILKSDFRINHSRIKHFLPFVSKWACFSYCFFLPVSISLPRRIFLPRSSWEKKGPTGNQTCPGLVVPRSGHHFVIPGHVFVPRSRHLFVPQASGTPICDPGACFCAPVTAPFYSPSGTPLCDPGACFCAPVGAPKGAPPMGALNRGTFLCPDQGMKKWPDRVQKNENINILFI